MNEPGSALNASSETGGGPSAPAWKRAWPFVKWSLFAALLAFVAHRAWGLCVSDPDAFANLAWRPVWLIPAMLFYVVGWLPSVWFWRVMLDRVGSRVTFPDASRAYFCGHLGKYIPGKALVLVIRAALLRDRGARPAAAALTAAYETLAMMAVGAALGVALAPSVMDPAVWERSMGWLAALWQQDWFRWTWTTPGALAAIVALVSFAVLPLLARLATLAAEKMVPSELPGAEAEKRIERRAIDTKLFATGMLVLIVAWWVHGLSLGCVLAAVSGQPFNVSDWPAWTSAVALATSLGFLAIFAPGGAGVREWVLIEVLRVQPGSSAQAAVAAAVLLRIVWLFTELGTAAILYWGVRPSASVNVDERSLPEVRRSA